MLTTKPPIEPMPFIVTRAFWLAGAVREIGSLVDLTPSAGAEFQAAGKVKPAPAQVLPAAATPVAVVPAAPARTARKTTRASDHAA